MMFIIIISRSIIGTIMAVITIMTISYYSG